MNYIISYNIEYTQLLINTTQLDTNSEQTYF